MLAERDDAILAAYVEDEADVSYARLRDALAAQTKRALVHPVFFGSAITGAGVESLMAGIAELLPAAAGDPDGPVSGTVFKIERGPSGEKIAYVRMFSGTMRHARPAALRPRPRGQGDRDRRSSSAGSPSNVRRSPPAQIAKLWGLAEIQIGDRIGETGTERTRARQFAPPTLESVVVAGDADDRARLRVALAQLAEQDPLINVRQDDTRQEISVSLYGEVQKEVIQATLANDFGLDVTFRETTPIYIERPVGTGEAVEILHAEIESVSRHDRAAHRACARAARASSSGCDVDPRTVPLYIYKTLESFAERMGQYVRETLREGLFGWQVTDCVVTMTKCAYSVPDGPPSRRGPLSTAADFRKLTPLVLMQALERAGTVVCEPIVRVEPRDPGGDDRGGHGGPGAARRRRRDAVAARGALA